MPTPKDKELYETIKKEIYLKYPKHSAYRSGILVKQYKEEYKKSIRIQMLIQEIDKHLI